RRLQQLIIEHQADIGIALDGDGDRVVLLDENATIISPDRLLSLFAQMCLENHPQKEIVFDVKCSQMVANTVQQLGGQAKMIRTGSSFLRTYLTQSNGAAVFGGEYAGHYVFNDGRGFGYDDGLYAALRVMEYLTHSSSANLSALLKQYPERCCTEDTYISTHDINPLSVLNEIETLSQDLGAQLSKIDGVRLDFNDGFGIIRASNTGEYFTVRFDADHPDRLVEIRDKFVSMLQTRYPQIAQELAQA
ncbi:MAG: phosphomannomutase/phosphoglucomutase, partial [Acinetobacter junii]